MKTRFTNTQLRKLCTGKPTATPGFHPSHRCKDVYLISPTGGPVCHYAKPPKDLKKVMAWHRAAMTEWMADPSKRRDLERQICDGLQDSKADALKMATVIYPARFIENGTLFFVTKQTSTGGLSISPL